jgi:hypothetical protein
MKNYDNLIKLYNDGISANQICIKNNINISSFMRILRKNNIKTRSVSDGVNLYLEKNFHSDSAQIDNDLNDIILGNMIGDGCIRKGKVRYLYCHTDKHREYLEWLKYEFKKSGIISTVFKGISSNGCLELGTRSYKCFEKYYNIFYNKNRIVPDNFILNPIILRQWFISDGSNSNKSGLSISKSPYNNNLMAQLMSIIGEDCSYHLDAKSGWGKFYIPKKYKEKFFYYIGECPVNCYKYKWRI